MLVRPALIPYIPIRLISSHPPAAEHMNLLTVVLRSSDEPVLSRAQMHRLAKAHRAHAVYLRHKATLVDSDDDDGPQDDDGWLMEDLKVLTHLYSRLRDREQLIALIFEVCVIGSDLVLRVET